MARVILTVHDSTVTGLMMVMIHNGNSDGVMVMVMVTWYMVYGTWYMVHGTWYMVHGTW